MTEQEHLEVSRKLALAIGYRPEHVDVDVHGFSVYVFRPARESDLVGDPKKQKAFLWYRFDYRDELIAFRVAERFDCFATRTHNEQWIAWVGVGPSSYADTPRLAIALAVIAAKEVK